MGKINNKAQYPLKTPVGEDYLIGSDSENEGKTVNFKVSELRSQNVSDAVGTSLLDVSVSFGDGNNGDYENEIEFVREGTLTDATYEEDIDFKTYKLIIDIPNYESISEYNPKILIDRYRPKGVIRKGVDRSHKFRKSGYKHERQEQATLKGRSNEFDIVGKRTIIDISPETYFKLDDRVPFSKGMVKRYVSSDKGGHRKSFVYLSLRLRLSLGDEVVESPSLQNLKMTCSYNKIDPLLGDEVEGNFYGIIFYNFA